MKKLEAEFNRNFLEDGICESERRPKTANTDKNIENAAFKNWLLKICHYRL